MTATQGAVAAKAASASEKTCLYRARVLPVAAMLVTPRETFAFHPIAEPATRVLPTYAMTARG